MVHQKIEELRDSIRLVSDFLVESVPVEDLPEADAIFVFGNYNPRVAEHAADLWIKERAPSIIVTGKGGFRLPEQYETEADFFASVMIKRGVPSHAIILEKEATNSLENVRFGMQVARMAGRLPRSVILSAIPPLLRRARATFRKHFPDVEVFGSAFDLPSDWYTVRRINRFVLGEIDRLRNYAGQGHIAHVPISEELLVAVERVRSAGLEE